MNPPTAKSEPTPAQLTLVDVLITLAVGVAVAVGLDGPFAPTGATPAPIAAPATVGAPSPVPVHEPVGADALAPFTTALAGRPPLVVTAVGPEALAGDPVLAGLHADLSIGDVAALAGRVAPGPATFEVWDLAERAEPLVGDTTAATVLIDGLWAAVEATPRIVGWFHYEDPAPGDGPPARILGVVTCCWRRDGVAEAAPAGWLLEVQGAKATLRQWIWLGGPGDGATGPDLVQMWAASGAWDPEPGAADQRIHYHALEPAPPPSGGATATRPE